MLKKNLYHRTVDGAAEIPECASHARKRTKMEESHILENQLGDPKQMVAPRDSER
jgi:hypothetical protein